MPSSKIVIHKPADVDVAVLEPLVAASHKHMQETDPDNDAVQ